MQCPAVWKELTISKFISQGVNQFGDTTARDIQWFDREENSIRTFGRHIFDRGRFCMQTTLKPSAALWISRVLCAVNRRFFVTHSRRRKSREALFCPLMMRRTKSMPWCMNSGWSEGNKVHLYLAENKILTVTRFNKYRTSLWPHLDDSGLHWKPEIPCTYDMRSADLYARSTTNRS